MVAKLAESIVDTLEKEKIITAQLREHYIYACITLIERIVTILSLLCIREHRYFTFNNFWSKQRKNILFLY